MADVQRRIDICSCRKAELLDIIEQNEGAKFWAGVWDFMNPPLWAMLVAIVVASVPDLQQFFFKPGSFVRNSVTRAIESNAGVAIPLILVVLGGNDCVSSGSVRGSSCRSSLEREGMLMENKGRSGISPSGR